MMSSFYMIAVSVLLELSDSSSVYNLQPAYITTNIGSTGRNIRHLPCISRKTNQSGVCMFAIDCLKSNGTHLGTCIDRFYFGSCCHVSTMVKISENTIDASMIPNREPPNRISSIFTTTSKAGQLDVESVSNKNTVPITNTSVKPTKYWLTTLRPPINANISSISENMSNNIYNSKVNNSSLFSINSSIVTNYSSNSSHSSNSSSISSSFVNQSKPNNASIQMEATINNIGTAFLDDVKFSTFQSVENNDIANSLRPTFPTISITTSEKIHKPVTLTSNHESKPKPTIPTTPNLHLHSKPIIFASLTPHRTTPFLQTENLESSNSQNTKPLKATKKPSRITTKPYKINKKTEKPLTALPHKRYTVVTKLPITTTLPVHISSSSDSNINSSINQVTTLNINTIWPTVTRAPSPYKPKPANVSLASTTNDASIALDETTQLPNEIIINELLNGSSFLQTINGNPATNEIDSSDTPSKLSIAAIQSSLLTSNFTIATTKPSLLIWQTTYGETEQSANANDSDLNTWQPITTPDGWVLLPSISTVTESVSSPPTSTSDAMIFTDITTPNKEIMTMKEFLAVMNSSSTSSSVNKLEFVTSTVYDIANATNTSYADNTTVTAEGYGSGAIGNISQSTTINDEELSKPVNMSDFTDVCGRRMYPEARIVGGEKSTFGRWPWQISLRQWRTSTYLHKCGAALLNENWAITAAHCVDNVPPSDLLLRLGEHDLSTESEPYLHQERRVQIVASHPQFDPRTFEYDLALLRFYEPITFQPNILPVCIPQTDKTFVGRTAHVTGWGRLYEDGPLPSVLQEVSVPVINNTVCESMYRAAGYIEHIPYIFICAGWRRGGFDSCEGDSGGPMVIQREDKRFLLAGIISWGIGCAEPNQPGVYTRISEFRDWINQILQF